MIVKSKNVSSISFCFGQKEEDKSVRVCLYIFFFQNLWFAEPSLSLSLSPCVCTGKLINLFHFSWNFYVFHQNTLGRWVSCFFGSRSGKRYPGTAWGRATTYKGGRNQIGCNRNRKNSRRRGAMQTPCWRGWWPDMGPLSSFNFKILVSAKQKCGFVHISNKLK